MPFRWIYLHIFVDRWIGLSSAESVGSPRGRGRESASFLLVTVCRPFHGRGVRMITRLYSAALRGVDALEVEVEVNVRGSEKPLVIVVGLPDAAVRESSQRVISAISASALHLADGTKTVNLAPADLKKEGPSFDLPIALAMASASENLQLATDDCCIVGELALDGEVRPVKGVLSIALEAKRCGRTRILVPEANAPEAAIVDGVQVFPIRSLYQAWKFLRGEETVLPFTLDRRAFFDSHRSYEVDFDEVKGQHHVKRALEIAAAGNHNLLMVEPIPASPRSFCQALEGKGLTSIHEPFALAAGAPANRSSASFPACLAQSATKTLRASS